MVRRSKNKLIDIFPGDMPVKAIYLTLGIEAEEGAVKCGAPAIKHAQANHPEDVPTIIPHLSQLIESPLYMGDDHRNPGKIEFVGRIPGQAGAALVAVTVERNENDGFYHVCSMYMISQAELDKKRDKGILRNVKIK